jgi:hypothetical protein
LYPVYEQLKRQDSKRNYYNCNNITNNNLKYKDLTTEVYSRWKVRAKVIPVTTEATAATAKSVSKHL